MVEQSSQDMIPVLFIRSWLLVQRLDFCSCIVPCCYVFSPNYSLYIICSNISFLSCCPSGSICAGWQCGSLLKWGLADQGCAEAERDLQVLKCTCQFWYARERDNTVSGFWALPWEPACTSGLFLLRLPPGQSPSAAPQTMKFYLWLSWMPMQNKTNSHVPTYSLCSLISWTPPLLLLSSNARHKLSTIPWQLLIHDAINKPERHIRLIQWANTHPW